MRAATTAIRHATRAGSVGILRANTSHLHAYTQIRSNRDYSIFKEHCTGVRCIAGHASSVLSQQTPTDRQAQTEEMPVSCHTFQIDGKETHLYLLHHDTQLDPLAYLRSLQDKGSDTRLRFSIYPDKRIISIVPEYLAEHYDMWKRLQHVKGLGGIEILTSARGYVTKDGFELQNLSLQEHYDKPPGFSTRRDDISTHVEFMHELGLDDAKVTLYPKPRELSTPRRRYTRTSPLEQEERTTVEAFCQKRGLLDKPEAQEAGGKWVSKVSTPTAPGTLGKS